MSAGVPILFVAHGAPTLALDPLKGADLRTWADSIVSTHGKPRAIVAVSPHWMTRDPTIGTTRALPLLYDFSGFDPALSAVLYPYAPAPDVAKRVEDLLTHGTMKISVGRSDDRKIDHGVWVPLVHMFPEADVPLVQLSLPRREPGELFDIGRLLAPLRDEGVLLMTTGVLVHNLRRIDFADASPPPQWARDFDAWCEDAIRRCDFDALVNFRVRSPSVAMAHPTEEHFLPLLVAAGAASVKPGVKVTFPVTGFEFGSLSRRCVQYA